MNNKDINIGFMDKNLSTSQNGTMPDTRYLAYVMVGLKNNPLLKNGISEKPEKENAAPKLREDNF